MQSDFQKSADSIIDISVQTAKLTGNMLREVLKSYLEGNTVKKGNIRYKELSARAEGKLENIEVTENNIRDFLNVARKYDVDFSLKRDKTTSPPTYHVFFRTADADNFSRAFKEYAAAKSEDLKNKAPYDRQKLRNKAKEIAAQPRERKEMVLERNKETSL